MPCGENHHHHHRPHHHNHHHHHYFWFSCMMYGVSPNPGSLEAMDQNLILQILKTVHRREIARECQAGERGWVWKTSRSQVLEPFF